MSSRKEPLVTLSPRARQDFIDILRYTDPMWGEDQLLTYRDKIDAALQAIGHNPKIGHRRNSLPATHLAYLIGSHVSSIESKPSASASASASASRASCISA